MTIFFKYLLLYSSVMEEPKWLHTIKVLINNKYN